MNQYTFKFLTTITAILFSANVWAHCPNGFTFQSEDYCLNLEWQNGEIRQQGVFSESKDHSPYLNKLSVRPELWVYSKAHVSIWLNGDVDHKSVFIPEFEMYSYMLMAGGHSHGARSKLVFDEDLGVYVLSQMSFQEMTDGCWQVRFKSNVQDEEKILISIHEFTNLNTIENYEQSMMCSVCLSEPETTHGSLNTHNH